MTWRDDRGAGTIEHLGIVTVAAILVLGLVGSVVAYPEHLQTALCRITSVVSGGDCTAGTTAEAPLTDDDLLPPVCMLSQTSEGGSVGVKVGIIKLGGDWNLEVTQFNDEYHATVTNGASAGVEVEAGGKAGVASASASASLEGTYQHGDTWIVPAAEWPKFEEDTRTYFEQSDRRWLGAGWLWGAKAPRPPDVTSHEGGAELSGTAGAGVGVPQKTDNPSVTHNPTAVSASVEASGAVTVKRENSSVDNSVTITYKLEGSAGAAASTAIAGAGAGIEGSRTGSLAVKTDERDQVQEITFETVSRGGAYATIGLDTEFIKQPGGKHSKTNDYGIGGGIAHDENDIVVTTTTLEVTNENRAAVEAWLSDRLGGIGGVGIALQPVVPSAPAQDDAMMQMLYETGRTSRSVYDASDLTAGFDASVSVGVGGGLEGSSTTGERTLKGAEFLGSPRADGQRPFVPNSECTR